MYAIAFDLDYNNTQAFHPTGVRQAYAEIGAVLSRYGFRLGMTEIWVRSPP